MLTEDGAARAASDPTFWSRAATSAEGRGPGLVGEATAPGGADLTTAARRLRAALAIRPDDAPTALALAEVEARLGREAVAIELLERLVSRGPLADDPSVWARLGGLRVRRGRYAEAAAAYQAATEIGPASADLYADLAEVLMADGRLAEAEARYRDAVAAASAEITGERRPRAQDLALAYYGLGVALDRDGQQTAGREMIGRALALDPGQSLLKSAAMGEGDLSFVPDGDGYYYLGLAAEVEGQAVDAEASFREYLARRPDDRWAKVAATHLPAGPSGKGPPAMAPNDKSGARRGRGARVVAVGTVETSGGISAPLVDAAWRSQMGLLDDCLEETTAQGSVRISFEMTLDGRGRVTRATVKAAVLGDAFARCAEAAVKTRLVVAAPARAKTTTSVRTDAIIAFP